MRTFFTQDQTGTWRQLIAELGKKAALPESLWLLLALREVYRQSWLATGLKTAVIMIGYYLIGILIVLGAFGLAFFILSRSH